MAKYLAFYLLVVLKLAVAFGQAANTLNETCLDDTSIILQIGIYQNSCPEAEPIIYSWVERAVTEDPRMAASLLRLHFHDCFVNASHIFHFSLLRSLVIYNLSIKTLNGKVFAGM